MHVILCLIIDHLAQAARLPAPLSLLAADHEVLLQAVKSWPQGIYDASALQAAVLRWRGGGAALDQAAARAHTIEPSSASSVLGAACSSAALLWWAGAATSLLTSMSTASYPTICSRMGSGGAGSWLALQHAAAHLYTAQGRHEEALRLMLQVGRL